MSKEKKGFFKNLFSLGGDAPEEKPAKKKPAKKKPAKKPAKAKPKAKQEVKPKAKPKTKPKAKPKTKPKAKASAKAKPKAKPKTAAKKAPPAEVKTTKAAPKPEPAPIAERQETEKPAKKGWFAKLKDGLSRSSDALTENITAVFTKRKLDDDTLQELEDILIQSDLGVETSIKITDALAKDKFDKEIAPEEVRQILAQEVEKVLEPVAIPLEIDENQSPFVILVVGVNGTGKTTTIGKLGAKFISEDYSVMLAAGDTFRAAAIDQLKIWGERINSPVITRDEGADSAGLAFDAIKAAREENTDILMIDTAGRLHNKADLMAELEKIIRVMRKLDDTAPHAVLLVLDATTGQNALKQVEIFQQIAGVTGIVMTKLDGTARGGILVAISEKFGLPVHAIGVGEGLNDLQSFDAAEFAQAIAGQSNS